MATVAQTRDFVIGVDTHARTHTYAVVAAPTGQLHDTKQFSSTPAGVTRALAWVATITGGDLAALWVVECTATFGTRIARAALDQGYDVVEAPRMDAKARRGVGKSDPLDAHRMAAAVLGADNRQLRVPREDCGPELPCASSPLHASRWAPNGPRP